MTCSRMHGFLYKQYGMSLTNCFLTEAVAVELLEEGSLLYTGREKPNSISPTEYEMCRKHRSGQGYVNRVTALLAAPRVPRRSFHAPLMPLPSPSASSATVIVGLLGSRTPDPERPSPMLPVASRSVSEPLD